MKKTVYLILIFIFITSCQRNEVIKTHGISYLEKREKLIIVNVSNKNDTIQIFGQPSTKGMTNDNLWIYIERTLTRGKLTKLGKNFTKQSVGINILHIKSNVHGGAKSHNVTTEEKYFLSE